MATKDTVDLGGKERAGGLMSSLTASGRLMWTSDVHFHDEAGHLMIGLRWEFGNTFRNNFRRLTSYHVSYPNETAGMSRSAYIAAPIGQSKLYPNLVL